MPHIEILSSGELDEIERTRTDPILAIKILPSGGRLVYRVNRPSLVISYTQVFLVLLIDSYLYLAR